MRDTSDSVSAQREIPTAVRICDIIWRDRRRALRTEKVATMAESIKTLGLLQPINITQTDRRLVTGLHRLEACKMLGWKEIPVIRFTGSDLDAELAEIDENLIRNELTVLEMSLALARRKEIYLAKFPETKHGGAPGKAGGGKTAKEEIVSSFAQDTAQKTDKTERAVRYKTKIGEALRDLAEEVAATSIADNQKELLALSRLPIDEQRTVIATLRGGTAQSVKQAIKQQVSAAIKTSPKALPEGPFPVLVIDPPWLYENRAEDKSHRAANPYDGMSIAEITALPIATLASPDAILWLWTTNAHIRQAFDIVEAWGFTYKTLLTWVKDRMGTGDWLRGQTEHCLMAVRGKPTVTLTNQTTALSGLVRAHSQKPDEFFTLVDSLCPAPPQGKCELFARQARPGWTQWGGELQEEEEQ